VRWSLAPLAAVVGAIIGFLLGVLVLSWPVIKFSPSLDLGSALEVLAILAVALLIDYNYNRLASSKKEENDLLLDLVRQAKQAFYDLKAISDLCRSGKKLSKDQTSRLLGASRELSNAVRSIALGLDECKIRVQKLEFGKVKEAREKLHNSLTAGPYPGPYDDASLSAIQIAMRDMGDQLTRLGFAICHR